MVAGKVKMAMGLQKSPSNPKPPKPPPPTPTTSKPTSATKPSSGGGVFNRSIGAYFPRSSAQVQPRPPDVAELLSLVEHLRERESHLRTQIVEQKLLRESAAVVPLLESEIDRLTRRVLELESENEKLVHERELIKDRFDMERREKDARIAELSSEVEVIKQLSSSQRFQGLIEASGKSNLIKNLSFRKQQLQQQQQPPKPAASEGERREKEEPDHHDNHSHSRSSSSSSSSSSEEPPEISAAIVVQSKVPRVPKPPPTKRSLSAPAIRSADGVPAPPPPPPPPPPPTVRPAPKGKVAPVPPPPPPPRKTGLAAAAKVKRVPEVVEFYHSLMRRDSRRDSGAGAAEVTAANARDLVGEIENRSAYLLAIKTDVETQGDFIRFLIKEVETAAFTDIEDVLSFVKWLDDELSYLVDERAVLKHFDWPEQKADALREAAFEYSDLKKLECEASSYRDDGRQACCSALKKMQTLLEKLEHGVYNLSRLRESATNRFKSFHIPVDWMLDTGFISQIKLASVKLAMKYMKRVSAELEAVGGGPEEEELIVQGVRFAFRVHQFAGGFDAETMRAFEELRDKARLCHVQFQNQQQPQQQRLVYRPMPC